MKIAYVVLHYLAVKDTAECINSILNNVKSDNHESLVVVVDNGSSNDSFGELEAVFGKNASVSLLRSEQNLGFACGNNLGFRYAKHTLGADFIVMLNNDTVISQPDFSDVLVNKFIQKKYSVLGPDIIAADGYHQNPGQKQSWGLGELFLFRIKKRVQILLSYFKKYEKTSSGDYRSDIFTGDVENTILHGACFIFSPLYIRKFEGLCDKTFLYMEEDILKLYADVYGFLMLYTSDLKIFHKEDASTNMVAIPANKKIRLKYKRIIVSSKIYSRIKRGMIFKKRLIKAAEAFASGSKGGGYSLDPDMPLGYLLSLLLGRAFMLIRGFLRKPGLASSGKTVFIGKRVTLKCKNKMHLGSGVTIQSGAYLDALSRAGLTLENGSSIGSGTVIRCSGNLKELGAGFRLGKGSSLADNCFVGATGGVFIGDNVIGGQNIRFHSSNHNFSDTSIPIREQGINAKGISVGNDCWIGAGAVFCDGITVGSGCVIGANAVITKSFPDNCIIAGVPAKIIRQRN